MKQLTNRQKNGRHASRPEKDLIFALPHFLRWKKEKLPTLNFSSRFLPNPAFSTFASRVFFVCRENYKQKLHALRETCKRAKPNPQSKNSCQKILLSSTKYFVSLKIKTT